MSYSSSSLVILHILVQTSEQDRPGKLKPAENRLCDYYYNICSEVRSLASALGQEYNVDRYAGVVSKGLELNLAK